MPSMQNVERAVEGHDPLASCAQPAGELRKPSAGNHLVFLFVVAKNLSRRDRRRSELRHDEAGGAIGNRHGIEVIASRGSRQRKGGDDGVAGAAHVEHLLGDSRHAELRTAVAAEKPHSSRSERQQDVGP